MDLTNCVKRMKEKHTTGGTTQVYLRVATHTAVTFTLSICLLFGFQVNAQKSAPNATKRQQPTVLQDA